MADNWLILGVLHVIVIMKLIGILQAATWESLVMQN